jgi:hypothetical protein
LDSSFLGILATGGGTLGPADDGVFQTIEAFLHVIEAPVHVIEALLKAFHLGLQQIAKILEPLLIESRKSSIRRFWKKIPSR